MINKIKQDFQFFVMCEMQVDEPLPSRPVLVLKWIWEHAQFCAARMVCRMRGHKWVDHSYGGPETGAVDIECERCGASHHTVLY